jgi:hypothetical protein
MDKLFKELRVGMLHDLYPKDADMVGNEEASLCTLQTKTVLYNYIYSILIVL